MAEIGSGFGVLLGIGIGIPSFHEKKRRREGCSYFPCSGGPNFAMAIQFTFPCLTSFISGFGSMWVTLGTRVHLIRVGHAWKFMIEITASSL